MAASDNLISLNEAAERLGVHYMTAYRYVRTGRLPGVKQGAEWRVDPADLAALAPAADTGEPVRRTRRRTDHAARLEDRLIAGDEPGAWTVVEAALTGGMAPEEIYDQVLAPAMRSIGERWEHNELTVGQEHLASNIALRLIGRLGPRFARRGRKRGTVVLGAPPRDDHGLPLALVGDQLRARGFHVVDLGANVPAPSFAHAVRTAERLVGVGICATTDGNRDNIVDALTAIRAATDAPVLLGGRAIRDEDDALALGATWFTASSEDVLDRFDRILAARTR